MRHLEQNWATTVERETEQRKHHLDESRLLQEGGQGELDSLETRYQDLLQSVQKEILLHNDTAVPSTGPGQSQQTHTGHSASHREADGTGTGRQEGWGEGGEIYETMTL